MNSDTSANGDSCNTKSQPTSSLQRCVNLCVYNLYQSFQYHYSISVNLVESKFQICDGKRLDPFSKEAHDVSVTGVVTDGMLDFCMALPNDRLLFELQRGEDLIFVWCYRYNENDRLNEKFTKS